MFQVEVVLTLSVDVCFCYLFFFLRVVLFHGRILQTIVDGTEMSDIRVFLRQQKTLVSLYQNHQSLYTQGYMTEKYMMMIFLKYETLNTEALTSQH